MVHGQVAFRYAGRDETFTAGDAYYGAPGHLPLMQADTELIDFSPIEDLHATMAVVAANLSPRHSPDAGVAL